MTNPTPAVSIYRDKVSGEIYHSVTRILGCNDALRRTKESSRKVGWNAPTQLQTRDMAAARGTAAHSTPQNMSSKQPNDWHAQQLTKRNSLARRRRWPTYRAPSKAVTKWALEKCNPKRPACSLESASGFATPEAYAVGSWIQRNRHSQQSNSPPSTPPASLERVMPWSTFRTAKGHSSSDWKTTRKVHS